MIIVGVLVVLALGGYAVIKSGEPQAVEGQEVDVKDVQGAGNPIVRSGNVIEVTDSWFSLKELEVGVGDSVTWVNKQSRVSWPASAMHPTYTVYPESDIKKCGTQEKDETFDACKGLGFEESYQFTFNEVGE